MSGSWSERAEAGLPLKPGDLGNALRELAAAQRAVDARLAELDAEVAAVKMLAGQLNQRLRRIEEPPAPAKAQGGKAAGGSS